MEQFDHTDWHNLGNGLPPSHLEPPAGTSDLDEILENLNNPAAIHNDPNETILLWEFRGEEYLVPADIDSDAATIADDKGLRVLADTDGDGRVDYVSSVDFDGSWSAWRWQQDAAQLRNYHAEAPQGKITDLQEYGNVGGVTPEQGGKIWEVGAWKCVERGEWG